MFADFDLIHVPDRLKRRKNRDFEFNHRKLYRSKGHETRVADGRCNGAFGRSAVERTNRVDIPDAAAQLAVLMKRNKNSTRFYQRRVSRLRQRRPASCKIGIYGTAGDLKKEFLVGFSELQCHWLRHDDAASFPTESGAAARVL